MQPSHFLFPTSFYHVLFHIVAFVAHFDRSIDYLGSNPDEAQRRAVPGLSTYQPLAALVPMLKKKVDQDGAFDAPGHVSQCISF